MSWAKLDDRFHGNPKVVQAWKDYPAAIGLFAITATRASRERTNGFVEFWWVEELIVHPGSRRAAIRALETNGIWEATMRGGWNIITPMYVPVKNRPRIPRWLRRQIIERDGNVCGLCGGPVEPTDIHIDHIEPLAAGGGTYPENLQVAHSRCNMSKGARV